MTPIQLPQEIHFIITSIVSSCNVPLLISYSYVLASEHSRYFLQRPLIIKHNFLVKCLLTTRAIPVIVQQNYS